ncbi:MAG TPA: hypothetical protein VF212_14860 [Longimicrobiales bacterium]
MSIPSKAALVAALIAASCGGDRELRTVPDDTADAARAASDTAGAAAASAAPGLSPRPADSAPRSTGPFEGTAAATARRPGVTGVVTQSAVRAARQAGYDRVVFEFADGLPGYHIEYVDGPIRHCASGAVVPIAGTARLRVAMTPARAHDDGGQPTVTNRAFAPRLPVVEDVRLTCDFEARLEWILGVAAPNGYRVLELREPDRLVVDVLH